MEKVNDKESTATVEVKEEKLEVAGGKCWRGFGLSVLTTTGEKKKKPKMIYFSEIFLFSKKKKPKLKYFTETWILPFAVLAAMVAYAVLAIAFYNKDG